MSSRKARRYCNREETDPHLHPYETPLWFVQPSSTKTVLRYAFFGILTVVGLVVLFFGGGESEWTSQDWSEDVEVSEVAQEGGLLPGNTDKKKWVDNLEKDYFSLEEKVEDIETWKKDIQSDIDEIKRNQDSEEMRKQRFKELTEEYSNPMREISVNWGIEDIIAPRET